MDAFKETTLEYIHVSLKSDDVVLWVIQRKIHLKHIICEIGNRLKVPLFTALAASNQDMKSVSITMLDSLSPCIWSSAAKYLKRLEFVVYEGNELNFYDLTILTQTCLTLRSLQVISNKIRDSDLLNILNSSKHVKELYFNETKVQSPSTYFEETGFQLKDISGIVEDANEIYHLEIKYSSSSSATFKELSNICPNIRSLNISFCEQLSPYIFDIFDSKFHYLTALSLTSYECFRINDDQFQIIAVQCPRITHIELGFATITDLCGEIIANHYPHLMKLHLIECRRLTDTFLQHVFGICEEVTELFFDLLNFSDIGLYYISKHCKFLTHFHIADRFNITDDGILAILQAYPPLVDIGIGCERISKRAIEYISVYCVGLRRIHFYDTVHFSESFSYLARSCPNLNTIQTWSSNIDDISIGYLASYCRNLLYLDIGSSHPSSDSLLELIRSCPRIRISCHFDVISELDEDTKRKHFTM